MRRKSEVMSPAGYWPQLHAAIEAGADAVYFGLKHFTARAKVGFSVAELPDVMRTLHQRGVRGFVTFNTLVFEHELAEAARAIEEIAAAQADALIVQDYGILRLAREIAPHLELHASTQMSITNAGGVKLAQSYGANRVTLARELSLVEIRKIIEETDCELEVFVHGALCVAYSGQCFSSEAWGGRSANRGQCAQACRLPYEMWVDGRQRPLADARYLLSPGDLYALEQVPELVDMGVATLKIEGRYKDAEYVALTTRAYRKAVDDAWAGVPVKPTADERAVLEQVYSRGLGAFFMSGTNHQAVVRGRAPRHRGVEMGRVSRVSTDAVWVELRGSKNGAGREARRTKSGATLSTSLKAGDGVVFDAADWRDPAIREEGGRIYQALPALDGSVELRFGNDAVDIGRIRKGDWVWRTHDPELDKTAKPYLNPSAPLAKQIVDVRVLALVGQKLRATWTVKGVSVTVESSGNLEESQGRALDEDAVRGQISRLGNTPYQLGSFEVERGLETPFLPASMLNHVRREAVEQLQALQGAPAIRGERRAAGVALAGLLRGPRPLPGGRGSEGVAAVHEASAEHGLETQHGFELEHGVATKDGVAAEHGVKTEHGASAEHEASAEHGLGTQHGFETEHGVATKDGVAAEHGVKTEHGASAEQGVAAADRPPAEHGVPASHPRAAKPGLNQKSDTTFSSGPQLHLLVRTPEQLDAALATRPASITLDYLDLFGLRPSIEKVKASAVAVRVASPRVLKPGEERILNFLMSLNCPILVRGAGMIQPLQAAANQLIGDFSLNASNTITSATYLEMGLARITPAYDLNAQQISALARAIGGERIEAVAYQHLPVFHMEHCVFCRFLSKGTSYKDCGRPCEEHRVALKDQTGRAHPVMADVGCRNTVFGAEAQEASLHLADWRRAGLRHFRLEFVHESGPQVTAVTKVFRNVLEGGMTAVQLHAELRRIAPAGVTEGSLFVPKDYLSLPVLQ